MRIVRAALAAAVFFHCSVALAQSAAEEPGEAGQRSLERQQNVVEEAARAALREPLGDPIAYEQILAAPDDVALNLRYARQQIARGDLRGASATLERILLVEDRLPEVRLLYGIVLFRMDSLDEAERELNAVAALNLPPDVRSRVEDALREIRLRRQLTRHSVTAGLGLRFDSNRNAAPRDTQTTAFGVDVPSPDVPQADFAQTYLLSYRLRHDLGGQRRNEITAGVNLYRDDQARLDRQDFRLGQVEAGALLRNSFVTVVPRVFVAAMRLGEDHLLTQRGAELRLERAVDASTLVSLTGRATAERYNNIRDNAAMRFRTGPRYSARLGLDRILAPRHRLSLALTRESKAASLDFYAYGETAAAVSHTWLLGSGVFLLSDYGYSQRRYRRPDLLVAPSERTDRAHRFGLTLGVPAGVLLPDGVPGPVLDLFSNATLALGVEHLRQNSNQRGFEYRNWTGRAGVTWRWEF